MCPRKGLNDTSKVLKKKKKEKKDLPLWANIVHFLKTRSPTNRSHKCETIWKSMEFVECNVNRHTYPFEGQKFPFKRSIVGSV